MIYLNDELHMADARGSKMLDKFSWALLAAEMEYFLLFVVSNAFCILDTNTHLRLVNRPLI
jgi:hypothetical protein